MSAGLFKAPTSNYWSTSLNGAINDTVDTFTLNSTTGLQYPGYLVIDREDANGVATPTKREIIKFTGISTPDLTGVTRAADGSTARSHADGALVEAILTVGAWNDTRDAIAAEHTTAGVHSILSNVTVTNLNGANARIATASISTLNVATLNVTNENPTNINSGVKGVFDWAYSDALATSLTTVNRRSFWRATKNLTLSAFWAGLCSAPSLAPLEMDIKHSDEPNGTFASIFTSRPFIDIGEFNSVSSASVATLALTSLASGRILQPEILMPGDAGILTLQLIGKERT